MSNLRPFGRPAFGGDYMYLPPCWGNLFLRLNMKTGEMTEWETPFSELECKSSGYYVAGSRYSFIRSVEENAVKILRFFSILDRTLYDVNLETNEFKERTVSFDVDELKEHEPGFQENSDWFQYACQENAFCTLADFLDGKVKGNGFDRERQIRAFQEIAANNDGTSGQRIYEFVKEKLY